MNECGCGLMWSSVGRKIIMALTGLSLFLFVVAHLIGNLTILMGAEAFNGYAHFLMSLMHGKFIYLAEAGLILFFLLHAWSGIKVWLQKRGAREQGYEVVGNAGGASQKTLASRSMILTGPVLLLFVILHVKHFKFGPVYTTMVHGEEVRDLFRLVVDEFNKPVMVLLYVVTMVLLGTHLKHGVWSAFQSMGWTSKRVLPALTTLSAVTGVALAAGFIYVPLHVFFFIDPQTALDAAAQITSGGH